ncbi:MAG: NAD(P)/FAD-dependent oxidoreductase [Euryarchaeota archaeon]|nr:NAD(P)/FAD-dependent oxidoreductase [Euryarchaeota archaeon]MCG2737092.1 NAD(P)/FAD-dependent oxidoreductase [Candidatus Methanoperedenaceae archaeon]
MEKYDTIMVGAGPAGLRAARVLAEAGKNTLVLEKNRAIGQTICAGGLTIRDLNFFPKNIVDAEFNYMLLHTAKGSYKVDLGSRPVFTVDREKLGQWMANEAEKAGAQIRTASRVSAVDGKHIVLNGEKIGFDHLVGADGSNSIVRKSLDILVEKTGIGIQYISKTLRKDFEVFVDDFRDIFRYGWIFPHRGFTSIGMGGKTGKGALMRRHLDELCNKLAIERTRFEGARINIDYKGFVFGNRFLAGDAGGFASGLTGEGIYQAILSGEEVAKGILNRDFNYPGIKHILKIKNRQENILRILSLNRNIPDIVFNNAVPFFLKRRNLCRMINDKYNIV